MNKREQGTSGIPNIPFLLLIIKSLQAIFLPLQSA